MRYNVLVKPGSSQEKVVADNADAANSVNGAALTVYLHARAHDGEANSALTRVLGEHFGVAKSCVVVVAGAKSRRKIVEIIK